VLWFGKRGRGGTITGHGKYQGGGFFAHSPNTGKKKGVGNGAGLKESG